MNFDEATKPAIDIGATVRHTGNSFYTVTLPDSTTFNPEAHIPKFNIDDFDAKKCIEEMNEQIKTLKAVVFTLNEKISNND